MAACKYPMDKYSKKVKIQLPALMMAAWIPIMAFADQFTIEDFQDQQPREASQNSEVDEHAHYNRVLRTQLGNLWAFVESAVISRTVYQAVTRPVKPAHSDRITSDHGALHTGMPGVRGSVSHLTPASNSAADKLISVLTQVNADLRSNPQGKQFILTQGVFSDLNNFMRGTDVAGITSDKENTINSLIGRIEAKAQVNLSQVVLDATQASRSQKKNAKSVTPFTEPQQHVEHKGGWRGRSESPAAADPLPDGKTIARRMESARTYTNWQDQLLRQTLAGAMVGAGLEAVITVTYKSVYEQRPPWAWDDTDTAEVARAAASGAMTGAVSTAATWALRNQYPSLPLWMTSTIVTGSIHLMKESAKIATMRDDALTLRQLAESMPATLAMSITAYLGEQISPVPLLGSIAGAITGRIAVGVAHNYLLQYLNTPSAYSSDIPNTMPSHISVGLVHPAIPN